LHLVAAAHLQPKLAVVQLPRLARWLLTVTTAVALPDLLLVGFHLPEAAAASCYLVTPFMLNDKETD